MTKNQFLNELKRLIKKLPEKEIQNSLDYYSEIIDDKMENGISEEDAVLQLGAPKDVSREIMLNLSLPTLIKTKCKREKNFKGWEVALLILGSPIWLSVLIALFAIVFAVYVVIWAVVISLWAVAVGFIGIEIGFIGIGIGFIITFIVNLTSYTGYAVLGLGISLISLGLVYPTFLLCVKLTKVFAILTAKITRLIKKMIIGKEKK